MDINEAKLFTVAQPFKKLGKDEAGTLNEAIESARACYRELDIRPKKITKLVNRTANRKNRRRHG